MDPAPVPDPAQFAHVRTIVGVVAALSLTRLLNGLAKTVTVPDRSQVHGLHLAWVGFMLLYVAHFWWFEFGLSAVARWEFGNYLFVIGYPALIFLTNALLYPDRIDGYDGIDDYFRQRRGWFYALLAALFLVDMIDTRLKGIEHFRSFGAIYPIRQIGLAALALLAIRLRAAWYQTGFVCLAIAAEVWWIAQRFSTLH